MQTSLWNQASELLQIGHKLEKWQWRPNLPTWPHHQFLFWRFVSQVKFSYYSKFHANIITDSRVMTIFLYKGLTRNLKIGNIPIWVLPNIWRLGWDRDTKFGTNVTECCKMPGLQLVPYGVNYQRLRIVLFCCHIYF